MLHDILSRLLLLTYYSYITTIQILYIIINKKFLLGNIYLITNCIKIIVKMTNKENTNFVHLPLDHRVLYCTIH